MVLSDLTLSLIALGGVFIAGLSIHSVWQARRAAPRRADPNPAMHREPVLQPSEPTGAAPVRPAAEPLAPHQVHELDNTTVAPQVTPGATLAREVEPSLQPQAESSSEGAVSEPSGGSALDSQPVADEGQEEVPTVPAAAKLLRFIPRVDGLVDAIVPISLEGPTTAEALLAHMPASRRAGTKPFLIEALNEQTREWEYPVVGQRYTELQGAIQLANRHGALNEIEYSEFVQKVEALALSVGGMADFPDMLDVVGRARELDGFASQHDAQLAIHLRARQIAWSVGYIQQCAARRGFVSLISGRMALPSDQEGAPPVLTLQFDAQAAMAEDPNQAALRTVTVHFDVPQTEAAAKPFEQWQQSARALAEVMDASLVDDYGRGLGDEGLAAIETELQRLYAALEEHGVPAGSMAARRLFS